MVENTESDDQPYSTKKSFVYEITLELLEIGHMHHLISKNLIKHLLRDTVHA